MAKKYKVKRYYGGNGNSFRAKPRFITILIAVLLLAGLGYLGTVIYKPAYDFIMSIGKQPEPAQSEPEPQISEASSEPESEPEQPVQPEHQKIRAVYAPHAIVSNPESFDIFLEELDSSAINAVMIDIKNSSGDILFRSKNEMAQKWGLIAPDAIDLDATAGKLEEKGMILAVKMSVFRDPKAASAGRLDYAINYSDSNFLWLDNSPENGGKPWLNPYSLLTREYIGSIMAEALDAGAKLAALEDMRFPDNSAVYASFGPGSEGISRGEILRTAISELERQAEEKGAQVAAYFPVTEVTGTELQVNRYGGGVLETVSDIVMPGVQPAQFGNDFSANGLEITNAETEPGRAVKAAVSYVERGLPPDTRLIPVLEGGDKGLISTEITALKELGIEEYVLYDADGRYEF